MATAPSPPPAQPPSVDLTVATSAYINIRNARSELKREFEAKDEDLKGKLAMIEGLMLRHLNAYNMENVRTEVGTFYRTEDVKPNIVDDKVFYDWIVANEAVPEALERRVKVGFVKEFMTNHEGLPPPGVAVSREYVVRVRKNS